MSQLARNSYLETQVLTATPQKLRLMLIEGAIRHVRQALICWDEQRNEVAFESLVRCRGIVAELLGAIDGQRTPVAGQVRAIYLYLFRTLAEAQFERSVPKASAVLKVLEIEQETWRQLCEQMPHAPRDATEHDVRPKEVLATGLGAILPAAAPPGFGRPHQPSVAGSQFSLEG